jgi:uncharacterized membrane protein
MNHNEHNDTGNHTKISTARMEAFSDGVMAIIITISVLELRVPLGDNISALRPLLPLLLTYAVSFINVGTYWNNHHILLRATEHTSTGMQWANLHLLFWLSLIPFTTGWLGANHGGHWPTAVYAGVLLMSAVAYQILQQAVVNHSQKRTQLIAEFTKHPKGIISLIGIAAAVGLAFVNPIISDVLIILLSVLWFIPDRRIEKYI